MKQHLFYFDRLFCKPAAFRRLCVETKPALTASSKSKPAAFRRLCVETCYLSGYTQAIQPAAFRRLCVETKTARSDFKT